MDKKSLILNSIIKEYLKCNSPIGSNELGMKLSFKISPSTIRLYFKELCDIGELEKLHISSGRVPTHKALQRYWLKKIDISQHIELKSKRLSKSIKESNIFCFIKRDIRDLLQEVINVKNRFLLLVFDTKEVVIEYNEKIERLMNDFLLTSLDELKTISMQIGLYEVARKLEFVTKGDKLFESGESNIYDMARELQNEELIGFYQNTKNFDNLQNGIYFDEIVPKGYIAIKRDVKFQNYSAKLFCVGSLYSDYEQFFKGVRVA